MDINVLKIIVSSYISLYILATKSSYIMATKCTTLDFHDQFIFSAFAVTSERTSADFTLPGKRVTWHIICNVDNVNMDNIDMLLTMINTFVSILLVKDIDVITDSGILRIVFGQQCWSELPKLWNS